VVQRFAETMPLSNPVRNFLYVVIDRRRTGNLNEIADAFELALDERMGILRAEVTSAAPLDETQQAALQQQLSRVSGKQVRCEFKIDPALIGGVTARIGSTVYDGSVRTQLQNMRERLVAH
jgi:F-type H+-transporting ATPase subunit delta